MSEQYPTQAEYEEQLNEIFAHDPELYNYIMYGEYEETNGEFEETTGGETFIMETLEDILRIAYCATYEWDGYIVAVADESVEGNGYILSISKGMMPPHRTDSFESIEDLEQDLDGDLGYKAGAAVWVATGDE